MQALVTFLTGYRYYPTTYVKDGPVILLPEPTNKYDKNAIKVIQSGIHIGYVPRDVTHLVKPGSVGQIDRHEGSWRLLIESPRFILPKILVNQT